MGPSPERGRHDEEEPYRAAFEHSVDGVLFTVPDGRVLAANPAACELLGASEEEICRLGRLGFSDPTEPSWRAALDERERNGRATAVVPMTRLDGTRFVAELSSNTFTTPEGETRSCVIFRDATHRTRLEQALHASNDVTRALLGGEETSTVLAMIARHARALLGATDALVITPSREPGGVAVAAADGVGASALVGRHYPGGSFAARIMAGRQSRLVDNLTREAAFEDGRRLGLGPAMVVPIVAGEEVFGNLLVGTSDANVAAYGADELAVVEMFAGAAGIAIALGRARSESEQLAILAEQTRIGADLHDRVIQQLFGVGLRLQAFISLAEPPVSDRIDEAVQRVDEIIAELRRTVYGLQVRGEPIDVAAEVRALADEAGRKLGQRPKVRVSGTLEDQEVASQLLLVAREALSNVVRHAGANEVEVTLEVRSDEVVLSVLDDGRGPPDETTAGFGLRNMAARASRLGGSFSLDQRLPAGTRLEWRVPVGTRQRETATRP